jgi:pimeloyl-ACP methyl ester carboxylesterase
MSERTGSESLPRWQRRFLAPSVTMPAWAADAPSRLTYVSDEEGSNQVWVEDLLTATRRRVTDSDVGIMTQEMVDPFLSADGSRVIWFEDPTGDEAGRWMTEPFEGGPDSREPLLAEMTVGWPSGLAIGRRAIVSGMGFDEEGFVVYASRDGGPLFELMRDSDEIQVAVPEWGGRNVAGLSADERFVAVRYCPSGSNLHMALKVFDLETGEIAGEQFDGNEMDLGASAWSPVPGDSRLVVRHELEGFVRPGIWDLATLERKNLQIDLDGEVEALDWWPNGLALLLVQFHDAKNRLYRYDLESGDLTPVGPEGGCIWGAGVRPDGEVWMCIDHGERSPRILSATTEQEVVVPHANPAAVLEGTRFETMHYENSEGDRIQMFLVKPAGEGPFPLVMDVHGGPAWFWGDYWHPKIQSLVDNGYAVALVNYRGSVGFGREWRDKLIRNIGLPETVDLNAAADLLIARGVADPERMVLAGKSWGGYLTLLGIGLHPDRWKAAIAEVPVGDYAAGYEDSAPALQMMDRTYLGAPPSEIPEFIAERSPITYADRVSCPVMILYGDNDSRCPPRQVENYIEALQRAGNQPEVVKYGAGHTSFLVDEQVHHMQAMLDFLERALG